MKVPAEGDTILFKGKASAYYPDRNETGFIPAGATLEVLDFDFSNLGDALTVNHGGEDAVVRNPHRVHHVEGGRYIYEREGRA